MIPISYSYRSLFVRWKTTLMTATGFTLVIAALIVMLAFINGVAEVCRVTGDAENVVVLNEGSNDEVLSQISRGTTAQIETVRGVMRNSEGRPLVSREIFQVSPVYDEDTDDYVLYPLRGVLPMAFDVHSDVRVVSGRSFRPSQSEIIVGQGLAAAQKLQLGQRIEIGRKKWQITGFFEAGGSAFESEAWCDLDELASQFKREGMYSTVVVRAISDQAASDLASRLAESRDLSVDAQTEVAYYAKQGKSVQDLQSAVWIIAWVMGVGAVFGVMNTMFAAISQRLKDIAILRLLGFMPTEILISFLLEAIFVALIGGGLGIAIGYSVDGLTQSAKVGSHDLQVAFRVDSAILIAAIIFSLVMGILGGLLPAMSAMRIKPLEAFR
jgi:putative ABC transport system permease protein